MKQIFPPSLINIILSHKYKLAKVCAVITTVLPWLANSLKVIINFFSILESRPLVGSSKNIISGLVKSSVAIEALFLSPPLKFFIKVFSFPCKSNSLITFFTFLFISSLLALAILRLAL